jgi:hypothetical protein
MGIFGKILGGASAGVGAATALTNNNKAEEAFNKGIEVSNEYGDKLESMGGENAKINNNFAKASLLAGANYNQSVDEAIAKSNENFEKSKQQQNADLANMGYTPQSNSVYADTNSALASEQALMNEKMLNNAADKKYNVTSNALNQSGGFYNKGYNNNFNAVNSAGNMKLGGYNALAAYSANKYNNGMNLIGAGLSAMAK